MLDFKESFTEQINGHIDAALEFRHKQIPRRDYLGASRLGLECSRQLQYECFDVPKDYEREITGQTLRIFQIGHLFEEIVASWLKDAGFELHTTASDGKQFSFCVAGGKIQGHVDGVITNASDKLDLSYPMLWECKSLNKKSWNDLVKRGIVLSKPIYAAQIALYQAYMEATISGVSQNPALFTAINKDTAELYHELVPFDAELAQKMSDKAVNILLACNAHELLPRISNTPTYYVCKICNWQDRCWRETSMGP